MISLSASDPSSVAPFNESLFGWQTEESGPATLFRLPGYVGGEPKQPVPRGVVAAMEQAIHEAARWSRSQRSRTRGSAPLWSTPGGARFSVSQRPGRLARRGATLRMAARRTGVWCEPSRRGSVAEQTGSVCQVARTMDLMTLHSEEPKAEVGVRELHDQLSRYLHHVSAGGEVVVTMRGRRVARLTRVGTTDPLADLRARGLVLDPHQTRRAMAGQVRLAAIGNVSDLVSEQRR